MLFCYIIYISLDKFSREKVLSIIIIFYRIDLFTSNTYKNLNQKIVFLKIKKIHELKLILNDEIHLQNEWLRLALK